MKAARMAHTNIMFTGDLHQSSEQSTYWADPGASITPAAYMQARTIKVARERLSSLPPQSDRYVDR